MHLDSITSRVAETSKILDLVQPGWEKTVDLDTFDMACTSTDVAAQVGLPYALDYDEDPFRELIVLGLIPAGDEGFDELNDAWVVEILDRINA